MKLGEKRNRRLTRSGEVVRPTEERSSMLWELEDIQNVAEAFRQHPEHDKTPGSLVVLRALRIPDQGLQVKLFEDVLPSASKLPTRLTV